MQLSSPEYESDSDYSSKPSTVAAAKRAGTKSRKRHTPFASQSPEASTTSRPEQVPGPIPSHIRSAKATGVTTEGLFFNT